MANPRIGPHIHHYPEDSGKHLEECWQAKRWLEELDPSLATPMIRVGHQDFYVFEPAQLQDGSIVIPERWFTRKINGNEVFFAKAWRTKSVCGDTSAGYVVLEYEKFDVPSTDFLLSLLSLIQIHMLERLPDPRVIIGVHILLFKYVTANNKSP